MVVLEDLTELIKAQQLAAWSEAARRVAHEIKNPLTPIRLAAERLLRKHAGGRRGRCGPALEEGVEIIVREVETMKRMVDEFSRFARMPRPQPAEVDLAQPGGGDAAALPRRQAGRRGGGRRGAGGGATARLDAEQIKSALDQSARQRGRGDRRRPGRVEVRGRARATGGCEMRRSPTPGPAFPPRRESKLFLPYFSTKGRGTGLGLAIVHRIVTDHHGTIRVEDNRPRGTVFTIALPQG